MTSYFAKKLPTILWVILLMMAFQLIANWVFVRFVHYEAQSKVLPAETYQAQLITAGDYAMLKDRSIREVHLSDGSVITDRQAVFYDTFLPNYKPVGDRYVLVRTLGTSHYYPRWLTDMLPFMVLTGLGLVAATYNARLSVAHSG